MVTSQVDTVGPFFAYWFSRMERPEWLSGSNNSEFTGSIMVVPIGSISLGELRLFETNTVESSRDGK